MKIERLHPETRSSIMSIMYVGLLAIMLFLAALFSSCSATKRLRWINANHPQASAQFYAERYPVIEKTEVRIDTVTNIAYMPSEVMYVDCDSAALHRTETGRLLVSIPCPPTQLITHLVTKDSIVRVENRAALEASRLQLADVQKKYESCRKWRNYAMCYSGFLTFILLVFAAFKVWGLKGRLVRSVAGV